MEKYLLLVGVQWDSDTEMETAVPVPEGAQAIDLCDGSKYIADKVFQASPYHKFWPTLPDRALHLQRVGTVSDDVLQRLREASNQTYELPRLTMRFSMGYTPTEWGLLWNGGE